MKIPVLCVWASAWKSKLLSNGIVLQHIGLIQYTCIRMLSYPEIILGLRPANERGRNKVMPSLISANLESALLTTCTSIGIPIMKIKWSHLCNGNFYTGKASLYWIRPQLSKIRAHVRRWFFTMALVTNSVKLLDNSLGPSDATWRQRSGSTLAQVMACCLTAPSHYLNQSWLIISKV